MASSKTISKADKKCTPAVVPSKKWSLRWAAFTFVGMVALQLCFGYFNHKLHPLLGDIHSIYWRFTFPLTTAFDVVFVVFLRLIQNWAVDKALKNAA